jgi:hypothetical protein
MDGAATACTEMACFTSTPPYCTAYADGRECTDATTCSVLAQTAADGERCASGFCENEADCPQCATGLACQVGAQEPRPRPQPSFRLHPSIVCRDTPELHVSACESWKMMCR